MAEKKVLAHPNSLTTRDVNMMFFRWWLGCETNHTFTRMQALTVGWAMMPALRKLYGDRHDELKRALLRETMYFNTQGIWGVPCLGLALAMEEEVALEGTMDQDEADASINGVKTGFMGPFAGIGDTIDWAILRYFFTGLAMGFIQEDGLWYGAFVILCFPAITIAEGLFFNQLAYRLGRTALMQMFASGLIKKLLETTAIIGLMMMGALSASTVKFTFAIGGVQETLDKILPGLMPILVVFFTYWLVSKKGMKVSNVAILYLVAGIVLGLLRIV